MVDIVNILICICDLTSNFQYFCKDGKKIDVAYLPGSETSCGKDSCSRLHAFLARERSSFSRVKIRSAKTPVLNRRTAADATEQMLTIRVILIGSVVDNGVKEREFASG